MKTKLTLAVTIFAVLILTSVTAFAYGGRGHQGRMDGSRFDGQGVSSYHGAKFQDQWESLTQEQKDQLKDLHQAFVDETADFKTQIITKKGSMRVLLNTSSPDAAELKKLAGDIADLKADIMEKRIDFILKVKEVAPDFRMGPGGGLTGMAGYCPFSGGMMHRGGFGKGRQAGSPCWQ